MKKYIILTEYFDKNLDRKISKDETLELEDSRVEVLKNAGIEVKEFKEEISKDETLETKPKKTKGE